MVLMIGRGFFLLHSTFCSPTMISHRKRQRPTHDAYKIHVDKSCVQHLRPFPRRITSASATATSVLLSLAAVAAYCGPVATTAFAPPFTQTATQRQFCNSLSKFDTSTKYNLAQTRRPPFTTSTTSSLQMSLMPIPASTLSTLLVTGLPSPAQYAAYWGRTSRERYQSLAESFNVSFLGVFGAYFLSFILGDFIAILAAFVAAFWALISPELKAYQRNWELRGGRDLVDPWLDNEVDFGGLREDQRGLYGAYYFGRVVRASVVEDPNLPEEEEYPLEEFDDYTMETDENEKLMGIPWKLRLLINDSSGRELQIHARMSEEYLDIEEGMPVAAVILSTSRKFSQLAGLTDFCIPDAQCWVGDYPYLDRSSFESSIVRDGLWDTLLDEGTGDFANDYEDDMDYYEDYYFEDDEEYEEDLDYRRDRRYVDEEEEEEYDEDFDDGFEDNDDGDIEEDEAFEDDDMREALDSSDKVKVSRRRRRRR